jgi:NAD(P)-dependent dehydrogenase (short-subunit alcohol dehydrogenase family)
VIAAGSLRGRTAVITGASRGIGAATARALARAGGSLLVSSRSSDLDALADELRDFGASVVARSCDVSDPASVRALSEFARQTVGQVDILVNNAGVSGSAPLHRITLDDWNRMFAINATGTFLCSQAFVPEMVARGWGRVVNLASIAALEGSKYIAAYAASKHAVLGFTRCIAPELAGTGVTIHAVCPGYVDTPMTEASIRNVSQKTGLDRDAALRLILESAGQSRLLTADEVAAAVLDLCIGEVEAVRGAAIVFDAEGKAHPAE